MKSLSESALPNNSTLFPATIFKNSCRREVTMADEHNCATCERPDNADDMVQCDHCDLWQHYTCAGVNNSIADRSWACGQCTTMANGDVIEQRSEISRASSTSAFSINLGRLVERQQMERARAELELQRRHLDEQQHLMNEALAPVPVSGTPKSAIHPMVSNSYAISEHTASISKQGTDDFRVSLNKLRNRLELCEKRAQPTSEQLSSLRVELELCRSLLEGFQSSDIQQPKPAASQPRLERTPDNSRVSYTSPLNPENDRYPPERNEEAGTTSGANTQSVSLPLISPQVGQPSVSHPNKATEMWSSGIGVQGKRQAFSKILSEHTPHHCPTTKVNNEQPRFNARQSNFNAAYAHEQLREPLAPSNDVNIAIMPKRRFELNPTLEQTRHPPASSIELHEASLPPRHSVNVNRNQEMPLSLSVGPTQQQLAARQSLARELPRFTGDPADWPIFISNYRYTTEVCGFSDGENMLRLQRCLSGPALESVRNRLVLPASVPQVIETLRLRFGRPELLINALLYKVREMPSPRSNRLEELIDFGMAVQALCDHIEAANERAHLSNPSLLQELVAKLPADRKMMWAGYRRGFHQIDLKTFGDYMASVVQDATSVATFEPEAKRSSTYDRSKSKSFVNAHVSDIDEGTGCTITELGKSSERFHTSPECPQCNRDGHYITGCDDFVELNVGDRWRKIRALNLCQNCLFSHGSRSCHDQQICGIGGCQFRHHPLLHSSGRSSKLSSTKVQVAENNIHRVVTSSLLFRIIPVTLRGTRGLIRTFAFLDEGSDQTLIERDLAALLGVKGIPRPLYLRWTGNTTRLEKESQQITIDIGRLGQNKEYEQMNARTVSNLDLPCQSFQIEQAIRNHAHLKGIPVISYQNAKPKILVGIDNLRLSLPLEIREGDGTGPVAVKTRLGWCVYGPRVSNNNETSSFWERSNEEEHPESVKLFHAKMNTPDNSTKETNRPYRDLQYHPWQGQSSSSKNPTFHESEVKRHPEKVGDLHSEIKLVDEGMLVVEAEDDLRPRTFAEQSDTFVLSLDRRYRQAAMEIGRSTTPRSVAQLDLRAFGETPEKSGPHPGETVAAETVPLATLPSTISEGSENLSMCRCNTSGNCHRAVDEKDRTVSG